jgi:transcription initiation factor IIE alpha subunit
MVKRAIIIGKSKLFSLDEETYLVYPFCCGSLFNMSLNSKLETEFKCPTCKEIIKVDKEFVK